MTNFNLDNFKKLECTDCNETNGPFYLNNVGRFTLHYCVKCLTLINEEENQEREADNNQTSFNGVF
jgi:hypothetical protein